MRAAVIRGGQVEVAEFPTPRPGDGQVLARVLACGVCGSDLHFLRHASERVALDAQLEGLDAVPTPIVLSDDVFFGHEFAVEVEAVGHDVPSTVAPGVLATSMPLLLNRGRLAALSYSNAHHCGFGEQVVLSGELLRPFGPGLSPTLAAMTEPMAVGMHAVVKSRIQPGQSAAVIGCGPVGLAIVAALNLLGIEPIVTADFSVARRELSMRMGAHEALDPRDTVPLTRAQSDVVFEAVGSPGVLDELMRTAPRSTRIVVVGLCMGTDSIRPYFGIKKELELQFVFGYTADEFDDTLTAIADGRLDVEPMITKVVALDDLPAAMSDLSHPEDVCKIQVIP